MDNVPVKNCKYHTKKFQQSSLRDFCEICVLIWNFCKLLRSNIPVKIKLLGYYWTKLDQNGQFGCYNDLPGMVDQTRRKSASEGILVARLPVRVWDRPLSASITDWLLYRDGSHAWRHRQLKNFNYINIFVCLIYFPNVKSRKLKPDIKISYDFDFM